MTHRQIHEHTWNSLLGNWGRSIGAYAAVIGLSFASVLAIILFFFVPPAAVMVYFGVIFFFLAPLMFGFGTFYWNIVTTGETRVGSIFTFFRNGGYMRSVGLFSLLFLIGLGVSIAAMLPTMLVTLVCIFQLRSNAAGLLLANPNIGENTLNMLLTELVSAHMLWLLIALILCYFLAIALILIAYMFFFPTPFVLMAHPGMKPTQCISWGVRCAWGFKGQFLLCMLECLGFSIVLSVVTNWLHSISPYFDILSLVLMLVLGVGGVIYFTTLIATVARVALDTHMPMPQTPAPPHTGVSPEEDEAQEFSGVESLLPEEEAPAPNPFLQPEPEIEEEPAVRQIPKLAPLVPPEPPVPPEQPGPLTPPVEENGLPSDLDADTDSGQDTDGLL